MADKEDPFIGYDLPAVAGRKLTTSVRDFERSCRVYMSLEQRKPSPDTGLISVLCEAVRLGREHCDMVEGQLSEVVQDIRDEGADDAAS